MRKYQTSSHRCQKEKKAVSIALHCVKAKEITTTSFACVTLGNTLCDEDVVYVDFAWSVSDDGAVDDALCVFKAPVTDENIDIANKILSKLNEVYGTEVAYYEASVSE